MFNYIYKKELKVQEID